MRNKVINAVVELLILSGEENPRYSYNKEIAGYVFPINEFPICSVSFELFLREEYSLHIRLSKIMLPIVKAKTLDSLYKKINKLSKLY